MFVSIGLLVTKNAGTIGVQSVAVFPPWWSQQRSFAAVAATDAPIAAPGRFDWMVVVIPETVAQARNLRNLSVSFLLNAEFARLCGISVPHYDQGGTSDE